MNNPISPESRDKIANVVEATFKAATDGKDPTEVLAKEATNAKLTVEQTKRACEATNVSITLAYNKSCAGEKRASSDFEIVSIDDVLGKMYAREPVKKTASYDVSDDAYSLTASKEDTIDFGMPSKTFKRSYSEVYKQASDALRAGQALLDEAETQETATLHKAEDQLAKIASMVEGIYGDTAASIEDTEIREYVNGMINKFASERPAQEPSSLLVTAVDSLKDLLKQASEQSETTAEVRQEVEGLKKLSADLNMLSGDPADGPINTNFKIGPLDMATMLNPAIGGFLKMKTQSPQARRQIRENFAYDPTSDEKFRDVVQTREMLQNAVMLNSLMKNDKILGKADPKKIVNSFNSIFAGMPQLTNNPELTRSALRYAVEYDGMDFPTMMSMIKDVDKLKGTLRNPQDIIADMSSGYKDKGKAQIESFNTKSKEVKDQADKLQAERKKIEVAKTEKKEERKYKERGEFEKKLHEFDVAEKKLKAEQDKKLKDERDKADSRLRADEEKEKADIAEKAEIVAELKSRGLSDDEIEKKFEEKDFRERTKKLDKYFGASGKDSTSKKPKEKQKQAPKSQTTSSRLDQLLLDLGSTESTTKPKNPSSPKTTPKNTAGTTNTPKPTPPPPRTAYIDAIVKRYGKDDLDKARIILEDAGLITPTDKIPSYNQLEAQEAAMQHKAVKNPPRNVTQEEIEMIVRGENPIK